MISNLPSIAIIQKNIALVVNKLIESKQLLKMESGGNPEAMEEYDAVRNALFILQSSPLLQSSNVVVRND